MSPPRTTPSARGDASRHPEWERIAVDNTHAVADEPSNAAERAAEFGWDNHPLEPGIGLSLSGGGFRAMLFHAGALLRLNELGLLSRVRRIASVSGGSITAGVLARNWASLGDVDASGALPGLREVVVEPLLAFSRRVVDVPAVLKGLLPWSSAAEEVAAAYDADLFQGAMLVDLPVAPTFVFCASNLQTGVLWRFTKAYAGDYLVGRLANPEIRLATAVAASSAFPPFLSPLRLKCRADAFGEWPSAVPPMLREWDDFRREAVLSDGGVYDNHGLEPVVKRFMTILASDGGAPFARVPRVHGDWFRQLQRVLGVVDNQVRALRRRDLIGRFKAARVALGAGQLAADGVDPYRRFGAYWGIATSPVGLAPANRLPVDPVRAAALAGVSTRLADRGDATSRELVNWGYAISDLSVRTHYADGLSRPAPPPAWPYPDNALA